MTARSIIGLAAALALAAASGSVFGQQTAGPAHVVDVFPSQQWTSLGAEDVVAADTAPDAPQEMPSTAQQDGESAPAAQPMPFGIAGEWRERGQRIVVLERGGRTFLLCAQACPVRDAVLPGGEIADGYRLKRLGEAAVIASGNGPDIELSLSSPAH